MNLKFALLAGISVSTAGIIGIVGYFFSRAKDLKDILNGEGKKPLDLTDTKDDADWDKLIEKYLGSNSLRKNNKNWRRRY
ncbi:hypothetical protein A6V39_00205 [Candidatus Mycoplasma haematobovis]|uniref:Uncharacterized protein n=1 Tax=Candidatus Mycoplasma haematobovis TaxID=432608 RepID=A0A1A9QEN2_9MOLU|nr:hypothetical protein [Candidatus Mycoplasma haematobovis]OAL10471.1 hypothetical protein A6V39_00205 [Candidatus Mycoplasma haematobovis]